MRRLYTLLLYLALPWATAVVLLRGLSAREYWRGWGARFGFGPTLPVGGIWVHAVSVGEVQAAAVLIDALQKRLPMLPINLTCATPTGRAQARALLPGMDVRYAPYDLPGCVRRSVARLQPRLLVIIETELWPNLLHSACRAGVPVLIASGRLSERSTRRYAAMPGLLAPSMRANVWVGAQSQADAARFLRLGARSERVHVVGNIKFDRLVPDSQRERGVALRAQYASGRSVWVAGSTQPGEEALVLQAQQQLLRLDMPPLLVLAPRHPQRFDEVAGLVERLGLRCVRRSAAKSVAAAGTGAGPPDVLLLDTLGELVDFYAAADVAFVGGSLVPIGGHNLLEPAALGLPVLAGPHLFNSPDTARTLREFAALTIVRDAPALAAAVALLLADPALRARQGAAGSAAVAASRGAREQLCILCEQLLSH